MNFENKKILVTGATGGIGNSLINKFYNLGGSIVATGTNDEKLQNLSKKFPNLLVEKFKLEDHSQIEEFIEQVYKKLGGLDILINNAGITLDNLSIRLTEQNFHQKNMVEFLY